MRIAGLASGRGLNLLNVADRSRASLAVAVAADPDAAVLAGAAERGAKTAALPPGEADALADLLAEHDLDLVCLDGYPAPGEAVLEAAPPTLRGHPSLLPAFPEEPVESALAAGVRVTGYTVELLAGGGRSHVVTQEAVPVREGDGPGELERRVRREGGFRTYPRAVDRFAAGRVSVGGDGVTVDGDDGGRFPARRSGSDDRVRELRYGENPHQDAALYVDSTAREPGVVTAPQRNEGAKGMSYNNYNDADAALWLVREFDRPAAAVIKHTNPAGCATAGELREAYDRALATDPMSAFGGVVALNRECDAATAEAVTDSFKEVVAAPGYTDDALAVLTREDDLRVLDVAASGDWDAGGDGGAEPGADDADDAGGTAPLTEKPLVGGRLVQERDRGAPAAGDLEAVTERAPTEAEAETMLFAWRVVKHVKSNAVVFAAGTETVGIGMGQVSRVDAVRLAAMKSEEHAEGKSAEGAVMASDAFFPFPDGVEAAAEAGVEAVVQPGGSVNDGDVVAAADDRGMAMAFTGRRAFRHD